MLRIRDVLGPWALLLAAWGWGGGASATAQSGAEPGLPDDVALRARIAYADSLTDASEHEASTAVLGEVARAFDLGADPLAGGAELTERQRRDLADSAAYYRFRQAGAWTAIWRARDGEAVMRDSLAPVVARGSDFARGLLAYMETEVLWVDGDWRALREPGYRAIDLLSQYGGKGPGYVAQTQQKLAFTYLAEDQDSARYYGEKSLRTLQARYPPCSDWVGHGFNSLATVYSYTSDLPGAVENYLLARNIYREALGPRHRITALADKNLGQAYFELSDLAAALAHLERAIDVLEEHPADYYFSSACEYYALTLGHLGDHDGARRWIERALEVEQAVKEAGGNDAALNSTWRQVAIFAYDAGDPEAAYVALDSADAAARRFYASVDDDTGFTLESGHLRGLMMWQDAERALKLGGSPDYGPIIDTFESAFGRLRVDSVYNYVPEARMRYGVSLLRDGQTARGLATAHDAVERLLARSGGSHHAYAEALSGLGELYGLAGEPDSARVYTLRGLEAAGIATDSGQAAPLALATGEIAVAYLRAHGLDTAAVPGAPYSAEEVADFLLDHLGREASQLPRLRYRADELVEVRTVMATAARAAGRRYDATGDTATLARARAYLAVPRAMTLRRHTTAAAAARAVALPVELRDRDRDLRLALAAAVALPDSHAQRATRLREAHVALRDHEYELRRDYPGYYRQVRSPLGRPPRLAPLAPGHARVRYLVDTATAEVLASVEVAGRPGDLLRLGYDTAAAADVARVRAGQADPGTDYPLAGAHRLYTALVAPLELGLGGEVTHLTIAGDAELLGLSFAALPMRPPEPAARLAEVAWLGAAVSVAYEDLPDESGAADLTDVGARGILAVAPVFDDELARQLRDKGRSAPASDLPVRTPWSGDFAADLAERYGADALLRAGATEAAVRERLGEYSVIHFATHGVLDADDPQASYFALTPGRPAGDSAAAAGDARLSAYELYDADVPARLAVLPNCHSGAGEIVPGDGVYSLATGLRYAGCAAVVQSLWAVDDEQTNRLLGSLYAGLADGRRLDDALRGAQAAYLAAAPPELTHPYYWAGLTVLGDAGPVELVPARRAWVWWGLGGAIGLLGLTLATRSAGRA